MYHKHLNVLSYAAGFTVWVYQCQLEKDSDLIDTLFYNQNSLDSNIFNIDLGTNIFNEGDPIYFTYKDTQRGIGYTKLKIINKINIDNKQYKLTLKD